MSFVVKNTQTPDPLFQGAFVQQTSSGECRGRGTGRGEADKERSWPPRGFVPLYFMSAVFNKDCSDGLHQKGRLFLGVSYGFPRPRITPRNTKTSVHRSEKCACVSVCRAPVRKYGLGIEMGWQTRGLTARGDVQYANHMEFKN